MKERESADAGFTLIEPTAVIAIMMIQVRTIGKYVQYLKPSGIDNGPW